ncbi:PQQ-dependent sugar dehydrogenase [Rhizobium sp. KVB221]|uniref:PQQ-dependent sugar dehydrogenase n=1 Tax=Rhizobium setariae TaxID=2801340 RepID=A0A937CKA5_9HYPH|nr:PQQ-dependent sugar dehydrogenase [Rhizobium setariae]MBL0371945.1 PQQ-dependent sugar dehydrogenase [Rhizobium setariae]
MRRRFGRTSLALLATLSLLPLCSGHAETIQTRKVKLSVETLAHGLNHPWAVEVLPDGAIVVTERTGQLRILRDGKLSAPLAGMPDDILVRNQGGLLDVALSPDFAHDRTLFFTASQKFGRKVGVFVFSARLSQDERSVTGLDTIYRTKNPGRRATNLGARIAFAPDKSMFVTLGDQFTPALAQDFSDAHGAVIRINRDGSVPEGNPFANKTALPELWTKGHRNPQGIAFDSKDGALYTVEHGARGGDEVNKIEPGKNYGWPVISYGVNYNGSKIGIGTEAKGFEQPLYYWDPSIAPGALLIYRGKMFPEWDGDLLVAALKFELISRLSRDAAGKIVSEERMLEETHGRLRDIKQAPDGSLLVVTDEDDGQLLRISRAPST